MWGSWDFRTALVYKQRTYIAGYVRGAILVLSLLSLPF